MTEAYDQAVNVGYFAGAEIDLQDGYIHFSTAAQLADTLAKHFAGRSGHAFYALIQPGSQSNVRGVAVICSPSL